MRTRSRKKNRPKKAAAAAAEIRAPGKEADLRALGSSASSSAAAAAAQSSGGARREDNTLSCIRASSSVSVCIAAVLLAILRLSRIQCFVVSFASFYLF